LLSTRARVRAALDRLPRTPDSFGMIHSDLHPANLIVDADRLTAIDFDDAAFGWFVSDLAAALVGCQDRDDFPALQAALVDGYRAQRPIAEATLALIPLFLLIRGLSLLGWMHQRPEVDWRQRFAETRQVVCRQCEAFQDPF
jgi:Ser/Thr protein kinase RdoA (MazF antagonist)